MLILTNFADTYPNNNTQQKKKKIHNLYFRTHEIQPTQNKPNPSNNITQTNRFLFEIME